MLLHEDRLFPAEPGIRAIARRLFKEVEKLPLVCPHGHTDPAWFSNNALPGDPSQLLIIPDHYVLRMLVSQGISLEKLVMPAQDGEIDEAQGREIWHIFAENFHLFRSTPTRIWMNHVFENLFGLDVALTKATADDYYDRIAECLLRDEFRPRELYQRFNIEVIATTDSPNDDLVHHQNIRDSEWQGRIISAYRPDSVVDPDGRDFAANVRQFGEITGQDTNSWQGYLESHRIRRAFFASMGATSTDHGHPTANTADLSNSEAEALFAKVISGKSTAKENELFRAQMLTEMAAMSIDDGLVMQIHAGSHRNHNRGIFERFGADMGFDIPRQTNYVDALKPLLDRYGFEPRLSIILFTLDETAYSRELAPLAGAYPSIKLGPAWWFFDSPDGMLRYREQVTETAGYYNTVGFNDDTRAFPSIPARHDVARRIDCAFLAKQVSEHRLNEDEAHELALDLSYRLVKSAYNL